VESGESGASFGGEEQRPKIRRGCANFLACEHSARGGPLCYAFPDIFSQTFFSQRETPMAHSPQFLKLVQDAKKRVKETNVPDVKRRMEAGERFLLIDVREDNEWAKGHLPNAMHLGRGIIERDIEQRIPDTDAKLILYCGGGFRSALVADNLQKMGYGNVESMDGGWKGWLEAGLPTAKD
jgi:rhodanese-related sulfurtransferase